MKRTYLFIFILVGLTTALSTCKKPTTAVFDNPNDPDNEEGFKPKKTSGLSISLADSTLLLSWADSSTYEDGYLVEWQNIHETEWIKRTELTANTTRWIDSLPPSFSVRYRVSSFKKSGDNLIYEPGDTTSFNATPQISTYQVLSNSSIQMSWKNPFPIFREIQLESSLNGTEWKKESITSRFDTVHNFNLSQSYLGKTISFRLLGASGNRKTNASEGVSLLFDPSIPTSLTITPIDTTLKLNWTASQVDGYLIEYKSVSGSSWSTRVELPASATFYIDTQPPVLSIQYRLSAIIGTGSSKSYIEGPIVEFDAKPEITFSQVVGTNRIKLNWKSESPIFQRVILESSSNGTDWKQETYTSRYDTSKTFDLTQSYLNSTMSFRLRGQSGSRVTESSNIASLQFEPIVPEIMYVTHSDTTLTLNWSSGVVDGYLLEYKSVSKTNWSVRTELPATATSYIDTQPPVLSIQYRLSAIMGTGSSKSYQTGPIAEFDGRPEIKTAYAWSATQGRVGWKVPKSIHKGIIIQVSYDGLNWTNNSYPGRIDTARIFTFSESQINKMVSVRLISYITGRYSEPTAPQLINFEIGAPNELSAGFLSDSTFKVTWAQANRLHKEVELQFREGSGIWSNSIFIGVDTLSYTYYSPSVLKHYFNYTWRVRTKSGVEVSPWAEFSKVFFVGEIQQVTSELMTDDKIKLYWTSTGDLIENTEIYRSENNQVPVLLSTAAKGTYYVELDNQKFNPNYSYQYTIRPKSTRATGTQRQTESFVFEFNPPSDFAIETINSTSARLNWKLNSIGQTKVEIKRAPASDTTNWTNLGTLNADAETFTTSNLSTTTWIYKVAVSGTRLGVSSLIKVVPPTNVPVVSELQNIIKLSSNIRAIALSKDGQILVSGADDDSVRIWNMATLQQTRSIKVSGDVTALAISQDKSMIAVGYDSAGYYDFDKVRLLKTSDGSHQFTITSSAFGSNSYKFKSIHFSPSNLSVLTSHNYHATKLYRVNDGSSLQSSSYGDVSIFSNDGVSVIMGDGSYIYEYDTSSFTQQRSKSSSLHDYISDLISNHNNTALAISSSYETSSTSYKSIVFRDYVSWDTLRTYKQAKAVYSISFSPDGNYLAFGGNESNLKILRVSDASLVGSFQGHVGIIYKVIWTPAGNRIITSSDDGTVKLWSVSSNASSWTVEEL